MTVLGWFSGGFSSFFCSVEGEDARDSFSLSSSTADFMPLSGGITLS